MHRVGLIDTAWTTLPQRGSAVKVASSFRRQHYSSTVVRWSRRLGSAISGILPNHPGQAPPCRVTTTLYLRAAGPPDAPHLLVPIQSCATRREYSRSPLLGR